MLYFVYMIKKMRGWQSTMHIKHVNGYDYWYRNVRKGDQVISIYVKPVKRIHAAKRNSKHTPSKLAAA